MPRISQFPLYTTPQDSDVQPIVDMTNTVTKKIDWSSIKSALKSYFDTLYGNVFGPTSSGNNNIVLFNGTTGKLIKEVAVFTRALSPAEISAYYKWTIGARNKSIFIISVPSAAVINNRRRLLLSSY